METENKTITIKKASKEECAWYGLTDNSYICDSLNYKWFPTSILMGVVKGKYEDTNNLGCQIKGSMGSFSLGVVDVERVSQLLIDAGYHIIKNY